MSTATSRVLSMLCEWRCWSWRLPEEWPDPDLGVPAHDAVSDSVPDLRALSMAGEKPRAAVAALQGSAVHARCNEGSVLRVARLPPAGGARTCRRAEIFLGVGDRKKTQPAGKNNGGQREREREGGYGYGSRRR